MDFTLSPEQELIRGTAREFLEREVVPYVRDWDRGETMDRAIVGLAGKTVAKWATDEQRNEWLPRLASGEALGCYALTEPGSGSDPASLTTRAERDGDDWLLTGSKIFITLGTWAKLALVFARSGGERARGITCFLVPTDSAGFEARPIKGKLGLRAQETGELFLEQVRVPDSAGLVPKRRASRSLCPRSTTAGSRLRPAAWGSPRVPRRVRRLRAGTHAIRQADRRLPARAGAARGHLPSRPRPRGC